MASVTQRIKEIKQPRGGYVSPRKFTKIEMDSSVELYEEENIHSILVGLVVDYMTRYSNGAPLEEAFRISLLGASIIHETKFAEKLLNGIKGLDDKSISNGCKLVGYDVCFRSGISGYRPVKNINPDKETIRNIRIMIERSLDFIKIYGPITLDGFTFPGAYTKRISAGDGDFLTENTLWDFKVSKRPPTSAHTLQILIYYLMGKRSVDKAYFQNINSLGIFNPRLNTVYTLEIDKIPKEAIMEVLEDVIGYSKRGNKKTDNLTRNVTMNNDAGKYVKKEYEESKPAKKEYKSKILIIGSTIVALGVIAVGIVTYDNQRKTNEELRREIAAIKENESLKEREVAKAESSNLEKENNKIVEAIEEKESKAQLEAKYIEADRELNNVWKGIVSYGADYPEVIQKQQEWIKYKDSKDLKIKTRLTEERTETLNKWFAYQRRVQGQNGVQFAQQNPCPSLDW